MYLRCNPIAAVDDHHGARRALLDDNTLRMVAVAKHLDRMRGQRQLLAPS
jgi:hypothetical protein